MTKYAKKLPYFKEFNPAVIAEGIDAKGQVIALPTAAYAQALQYNRQLFSEAGLNPNNPPTTWAQVEADAKAITQKTGMTGFSEMGANDNTAGWILTTLDYALGGRMEKGVGTKATATFDNPQAVQALEHAAHDALDGQRHGFQLRAQLGHLNQAFAAGQIGMFVTGSDVYTNMVQADNINPSIYGLAPIPLANNKNAGVLGGGTLAAVKPTATPAQIAAAMKWINFFYMSPLVNKEQAIRNAKTLVANKQPVGVPGAADLQPEAVRPLADLDQAVHQRSTESDRAVQQRDLQGEGDPGARGVDPGRLRRSRLGRGGGAHRPEREHPEPPPAGERRRSGVDRLRGVGPFLAGRGWSCYQ